MPFMCSNYVPELNAVSHTDNISTITLFLHAEYNACYWLLLTAHGRPHDQNLFGIVQGGLDPRLR